MADNARLLPLFAAVLLCCCSLAQCRGGGGGGQNYTSMFSFGDSLTDTGNLLVSSPLSNHIVGRYPYGMTYFHRPTGRCSDGRLVVDFLGASVCVRRRPLASALLLLSVVDCISFLTRLTCCSASVRPAAAAAVPAVPRQGPSPGRQLRRRRRHRHGSAFLPGDRRVRQALDQPLPQRPARLVRAAQAVTLQLPKKSVTCIALHVFSILNRILHLGFCPKIKRGDSPMIKIQVQR